MNSLILLLALGSLQSTAPTLPEMGQSILRAAISETQSPEPHWVFQTQGEVKWPKLDPREGAKATLGTSGATGKVPAIRGSQFKEPVPSYQDEAPPTQKPLAQPSRLTKPAEKPTEKPAVRLAPRDTNRTQFAQPVSETGRSKFGGENRIEDTEETEEAPATTSRPRFGGSARQSSLEDENTFMPTTRLKTGVTRQERGGRDSAPSPLEFRGASGSDDPEQSERVARYESFAIGAGDGEDDLGVDPYDVPLPSGRRGEERLASNRGDSRDTRNPADDGDESTSQGGSKVPGNGSESSMWGSIILVILLFASMGGNLYLAWVVREFYERYRSLAQQVRSARNNLT